MKLYFSPGACSLAPHIVLREAGFQFDLERVNLANKETASGVDFRTINPKGYVPALQLDNDHTSIWQTKGLRRTWFLLPAAWNAIA